MSGGQSSSSSHPSFPYSIYEVFAEVEMTKKSLESGSQNGGLSWKELRPPRLNLLSRDEETKALILSNLLTP